MYSRSYPTERQTTAKVPNRYDGCAFSDEKICENLDTPPALCEPEEEIECSCEVQGHKNDDSSQAKGGFLSGILGSLFGGGRVGFGLPKIGAEEILIIATALFLLFSKEGDNECALLLLLLLLIN